MLNREGGGQSIIKCCSFVSETTADILAVMGDLIASLEMNVHAIA